jgi:hypothetical protein
MKSHFLAALCATIASQVIVPTAHAQLPKAMAELPPLTETPAQHDARMQWWRDAKFGLFIHWGPVAISKDGTNWENLRTFDRLASPLEVSLSQTIAGAEVLGRPVRSIRIQADAPLQVEQIKVHGKSL